MEIYTTDDRSGLPLDLTPDDVDALGEEAGPCDGIVFIPEWEDETTVEVADLLRTAVFSSLETTMEGVSDLCRFDGDYSFLSCCYRIFWFRFSC